MLAISCTTYAQSYFVNNIVELSNDLEARRAAVTDANGNGCALIRLNLPSVKDISFSSSIVGSPEYLPGEYNVYVPEKCPSISFVADGNNYDINFAKYGISIEKKKCYRVVLSKKKIEKSQRNKTIINANYDNAIVMIDGIPVGQTPLVLGNITPGNHVISVPNTFGVTMNDRVFNITHNSTITLDLHKEKRTAVNVDIATPGGDSAGWYAVFGTNVVEKNGKEGIVDYAGNIVVPCIFDYVYPSIQNGYYVVWNNDKCGLYEPGKGLIVPCIYGGITTNRSYTHEDYMEIRAGGRYGVLSPTGEVVVPLSSNYYPHCCKEAIIMKTRSGFGLCSNDGNWIVEPKYEHLSEFSEGVACFALKNGECGFVDINGNETMLPNDLKFHHTQEYKGGFQSGLLSVNKGSWVQGWKYGYINKKREIVIPVIYDSADDFENGLAYVNNYDENHNIKEVFVIDVTGKIICSAKNYEDIDILEYKEERSKFIKLKNNDGLWGVIGATGDTIAQCRYKYIDYFNYKNNHYFILKEDDKTIVQDDKHNIMFTLPKNLEIRTVKDGFIMVCDEESQSYGYLNVNGDILANCIYGYKTDDTLGSAKEDEESGYTATDILYTTPISEGLAILNIGDRFGFIDNKGVVKVPLIYTAVTPFENGVSYVRQKNGKWKKLCKKDLLFSISAN